MAPRGHCYCHVPVEEIGYIYKSITTREKLCKSVAPKIGHIYKIITISRKKLCKSVAPRMHNKLVPHRLIEEKNATIDFHKSRTQFNVRSAASKAKDHTEDRNVTTVGYHRQG